MKRIITLALMLCSFYAFFPSCQKAPELTLTGPSNIELSADGSSASITFTANRDWRVSCSENWISVTPSSGAAFDGPVTVTVRCVTNMTFEVRSAIVTIKMEELRQDITVNQAARVAVTRIDLNKTYLNLMVGDTETLVATVQPDDATDKTVIWTSSETSVASVSETGKVTALKVGTSTITAKAEEKTRMCSVTVRSQTVPEGAVDLGIVMTRDDGTTYNLLWADCNLGAGSPEWCGDYYAWGETETKNDFSWDTYKFWISGDNHDNVKVSKYNMLESCGPVDNKTVLDPEDDVAHVKLGGKWRMPTLAELEALRNKCMWTWTNRNGMNGYEVKSNVNSNSIFLPAASRMVGVDRQLYGVFGVYWSSSLYDDRWASDQAYCLEFNSNGVNANETIRKNRFWGLSVRPVTE